VKRFKAWTTNWLIQHPAEHIVTEINYYELANLMKLPECQPLNYYLYEEWK
jgi:hypothetical protein